MSYLRFIYDYELKEHQRICRDKRFYECYLCDKPKFRINKCELRRHMIVHHIGGKYYECNGCNKSFSLPKYLAHHITIQHPKLLVQICLICGRQFATKNEKNETSK